MWLQVPHTIRIDVNGRRSRGVHAADFALSIIKQLGVSSVEYAAIEYDGSALSQMSVNDRAVLANLSAELGAKAVLCPFEAITRRYLTGRVAPDYAPVIADKDAVYTEMYQINVDRLSPQIAGPNRPDEIRAAAELEEVPVHLIVLGGCMSGHYEELRTAAEILKGRQVHPDCRLLVVPASRTVYLEALKKGLIRVLVEAGAIVTNPAAEVPLEGHGSWLAADERCLTTASCCVAQPHQDRDTEIYLCSAATAAASAVNAAITDPTRYIR
jgi:3-isopropylmalate/(R)-2-methylmalate dehydratase large subunit